MKYDDMSEQMSKICHLVEKDRLPGVWYEFGRTFTRCEVICIQQSSEYMGGVSGEQRDIYQYRDHDGAVWEIEVDRHDDDGHELDDSDIAEHATRIRRIDCTE